MVYLEKGDINNDKQQGIKGYWFVFSVLDVSYIEEVADGC